MAEPQTLRYEAEPRNEREKILTGKFQRQYKKIAEIIINGLTFSIQNSAFKIRIAGFLISSCNIISVSDTLEGFLPPISLS